MPQTTSAPALNPKGGHGRLRRVDPAKLCPSPENEALYRAALPTDPAVVSLAKSIRREGLLEPIIVTADGFIVSGHRRHAAARLAKLAKVPVRYLAKRRADFATDEFVALLREHNRQRVKGVEETLAETLADLAPAEAYAALLERRQPVDPEVLTAVDLSGSIRRKRISPAKSQMVEAVLKVIEEHRRYLPLNDRRIHYELAQHHRPLRHASKPDSVYGGDARSYKDLTNLLARMRSEGRIPHGAIDDPTRPETVWPVHPDAGAFIHAEVEGFGRGYWRDLMKSQPDHIEVCVEKNTALKIVEEVALEYTIPVTSLRGMPSLPTKFRIAQRFKKSGKPRLILLLATDHDPTGEAIAENLPVGLRDEFGVENIVAYKIAVTAEQARELGVLESVEGIALKSGDTKAKRFRARYGADATAYELEALSTEALQRLTHEAIDAVLNIELLNAERDAERQDAVEIETLRRQLLAAVAKGGHGPLLPGGSAELN